MLYPSNTLRVAALGAAMLCIPAARLAAQSFTSTPTGTLRDTPTATLLPNGKVLVAGGTLYTFGAPYGTTVAELFNPTTGLFTATGPLNVPRTFHTATRLANGKVLIAGGRNGTAFALTSAELYDPATGTFTPTNPMNAPRASHTATLLANGQVLIAGGNDATPSPLASAELYNPATGIFTPVSSPMTAARQSHSATLLSNDKVLIAGGFSGTFGTAVLATVELFNPSTGAFAATSSMTAARALHTATVLPHGEILIAGGIGPLGPLSSTELYSPKTGAFSPSGQMTTARQGHTATLLDKDQVLIAGGFGLDRFSIFIPLGTAELYDSKSGTSAATVSMVNARQGPAAALMGNGQVLIAGASRQSVAELFNPRGRLCAPGAAGCGWHSGDVITLFENAQDRYSGLLLADFDTVYATAFGVILGNQGLYTMVFTEGSAILSYLPANGPPAPLNGSVADPTTTAAGIFGGDVLTLKLNVDFSDSGLSLGSSKIPFGNLTLCNFAAPSLLNGWTVRQIVGTASTALGAGSSIFSIADLDATSQTLNASFFSGDPTSWAKQHLVNGACQ